MIDRHGSFAIQYPANWTAPQFQFGQAVQVREQSTGQIVGLEHYTREQADAAGCVNGWWYFVLHLRTLTDGRVIADTIGHHESVIQAVPCVPCLEYEHGIAV